MRNALIALLTVMGLSSPASAQLSIDFNVPGANIGINLPVYPQLQRVPGYPVYYAPGMNSNYFFYDGMYWVYQSDNWYASSWYNGPWGLVDPIDVPVFVLRVPVRYYRQAPSYFHGWRADAAPQWGDHWGQSWEKRRSGWDQWNHNSAPAPAPLPTYQRQYSGNRYPQSSQQASIQNQNYRYQPTDAVAQQHFQQVRTQAPATQARPATQQQQQAPRQQQQTQQSQQSPRPQQQQQQQQQQQAVQPQPARQPQQAERKPQPAVAAHEQQAPRQQPQERAPQGREQGKEQGNEQGREKESKDK